MKEIKDYSLLPHNTFGMDVKASLFVEYESVTELQSILSDKKLMAGNWLHIGGGSNLLFKGDYAGTVLHSAIRGYEVVAENEQEIEVRAGAGEVWDDFVAYTVKNSWYGAENLSLIPGEVGASAVQNIGAYGVEAKDLIVSVETVEVETGRKRIFTKEECRYAYRESIFMKDLKEKGLDENTIIFFFSDHGGCIPRGKGYLYESGLRVPLIVYFPPKWQHLANNATGKEYSLVNFTDLGPTVLSLSDIKPPKHMQGRALYGKFASREKRTMQFALAANQLHHFMPVRAVTDGHFKYIRSYIPYRQFALRNYYQWGMPSNKAWDKLVLGGHNTNPDWKQTFEAHPAEMLFDLEKDPDELHDLSTSPEYVETLFKMRQALSEHIRTTGDLGFFLPDSRTGHILYEKVRKEKYPLDELYTLVETAGTATVTSLPMLEEALSSPLPEIKFWGVVGYAKLAREKQIKTAPQTLLKLLQDDNPYIASEAAYAVAYMDKAQEGIARLVTPVQEKDRKIGYSSLECLSLDPEMRDYIRPFLPELRKAAETLPRLENEDAGLMARGILVNLGEMDIKDLHGSEAYKKGLKLNYGRRPMVPLPN